MPPMFIYAPPATGDWPIIIASTCHFLSSATCPGLNFDSQTRVADFCHNFLSIPEEFSYTIEIFLRELINKLV